MSSNKNARNQSSGRPRDETVERCFRSWAAPLGRFARSLIWLAQLVRALAFSLNPGPDASTASMVLVGGLEPQSLP